jgi:[acyl-carrier-protein] S-malonyltransferase
MGTLMQEALIGGQLGLSLHGRGLGPPRRARPGCWRWWPRSAAAATMRCTCRSTLAGMLVLAGNEAGLKAFEAAVPPVQGRFPLRLGNHAAFHSPLQAPVAAAAARGLPPALFRSARLPLIDGRGDLVAGRHRPDAALRTIPLAIRSPRPYDFHRARCASPRGNSRPTCSSSPAPAPPWAGPSPKA